MSDMAPFNDILQRVEQMLDALDAFDQSSTDFRNSCDQLDRYLNDKKSSLMAEDALSQTQKSRAVVIIERLAGLQKRAEIRANIPTELQKYIAEQSD